MPHITAGLDTSPAFNYVNYVPKGDLSPKSTTAFETAIQVEQNYKVRVIILTDTANSGCSVTPSIITT